MDNPPFIDDVQIKPPLIVDFQLPWITKGASHLDSWETFLSQNPFENAGLAAIQTRVRYLQSLWCMQNMQRKNPSQDMASKKQHVTCFRLSS